MRLNSGLSTSSNSWLQAACHSATSLSKTFWLNLRSYQFNSSIVVNYKAYSTHHCLLRLSIENICDVLICRLIEMSEEFVEGGLVKSLPSQSDIFLFLCWRCVTLRKMLEEAILERELLKMKL